MTNEIKATEEIKCDCKEKVITKLKEFAFIAGAVFVGGTLSILVSASLLKPKYPMSPIGPRPEIHRQVPPPMMHRDFDRGMMKGNRDCSYKRFKEPKGEFNGPNKGEFNGKKGAQKWDKKPPVAPVEKTPEKK